MRTWLIWLGALFVFANFCVMIEQKRALLGNGQDILLKLAPRDPRSLMQGDYMALSYDLANKLYTLQTSAAGAHIPSTGAVILHLDDHRVAEFVRIDDGTALATGEQRMRYRRSDDQFTFGVENYFVPEGTGDAFKDAVYGDVRVSATGDALLVGLCDKDFHPLKIPAK
jgi:uncharacterized membrane-anchored protein